MKTFDCPCGARVEADADDDLLAVVKQHADEQHGGDPAFSDMSWRPRSNARLTRKSRNAQASR